MLLFLVIEKVDKNKHIYYISFCPSGVLSNIIFICASATNKVHTLRFWYSVTPTHSLQCRTSCCRGLHLVVWYVSDHIANYKCEHSQAIFLTQYGKVK